MSPIRLAGLPLACLFLASPVHALTLNDTGQIACYNTTAGSTGTVSGADASPEDPGFEGQDCSLGAAAADAVGVQLKIGASSVPGRDYTKIANDGSELPPTATQGPNPGDWGCTRDNITGLVWELRSDDGGLRDIDHRYAWGGRDARQPRHLRRHAGDLQQRQLRHCAQCAGQRRGPVRTQRLAPAEPT